MKYILALLTLLALYKTLAYLFQSAWGPAGACAIICWLLFWLWRRV